MIKKYQLELNLTIIYTTVNLEDILFSDSVYIINNKKISLISMEDLFTSKIIKDNHINIPVFYELKDKLKLDDALEHAGESSVVSSDGIADASANAMTSEAVQALVALGYGNTEALKAVRQVEVTDGMNVEDVLRQALKYMI